MVGNAQALNISIGTVDRALHGRPDVSPTTRSRVLKKAEQLGYRPNLAARSLKLNRRLRIGVYFPREISSFFDPLRSGVRAAASAASGVNVELLFRTFPRLDEGDVELLMANPGEGLDGILVASLMLGGFILICPKGRFYRILAVRIESCKPLTSDGERFATDPLTASVQCSFGLICPSRMSIKRESRKG